MPKSANQKMKLLYLLKILAEKTDENHCLSANDLIMELSKYDINAERKSIYDDIRCLTDFGYDILHVKKRETGGYYLAGREFELPELKLLVDAVQASRFITQKKSKDLIAKIEKLAGPYDAKKLQRQVLVAGRIKAENESIYYNVDEIHNAIQEDVPIVFTYMEWTIQKELRQRKEGRLYHVSPLLLTWRDENYYLIAYDEQEEKMKHFRVDKMSHIESVVGERRKGTETLNKTDLVSYINTTFGMFGGEEQTVTLLLPISMIGILIDRFGKKIDIRKREEGMVSARIKVAVSGQFYGWLTGLSHQVSILSPENIRRDYIDYLKEILQSYSAKENIMKQN